MSSKACLYNLIVIARDKERLDKVDPFLNILLSHFPGRLITLLDLPEKEKKISVKELDPIPLQGSSSQTRSRISLTVSGYEREKVALTPLPYLIPDYPILLFWLAEGINDYLFETFYKISSRVLVDGDYAPDLKGHFETLSLLAEKKLPVVDVSWSRGEGWRSVFREVFSSKESKASLERCNLIKITYVEGCTLNPLLFEAWLKTMFDWKEGTVEFSLIPKKVKTTPQAGAILNIECTSPSGDSLAIYKEEHSLEVTVHICTEETCDLPMTLYLPNINRGSSYLSSWIWGPTQQEMVETLKIL
jgi:hypothetical protein